MEAIQKTWGVRKGSNKEGMRQGGAPTPLGRALHPRGPLVAPLTYFFLPYIPIYPKNIGEHNRSGVPPLEASVATESQSRPVLAPFRRGNPSPVAIFIITEGAIPLRWLSSPSRCSPWRGGSSSPSGLRVCTSSYVFDLSLSLSCSSFGTILMYRELCYYSWIL